MVSDLVWGEDNAGSNPVTPTIFNVRYSKWMAVNHIPSICVVVGKYLNYSISIHFWSCSVIVQCIVKDVIAKIADSNPQLYPILMGLSTI